MGTISEKLTYLNETKGKIKDSINLTGAGITDQDTFRSYETKLKDGFVDIINNGVDTLYENFPKVVQTGEEPTLNGVYEAPMRVDLNGNTEQSILPSGYTQVDYIESTGNQYINTGINGDYKLSIKTKIVNLNTSGSMFGAMSGSGAGRQRHHFQITQTTISNWAGTGDSGCQTTLVSGTEAGKTYDIFCDVYNQKYYVDDVEVTGVFNSNDFDTGLNYYLFARNNSGTVDNFSKIRMYYFKMYIQDVLVRDFVPCYRNSDSAVGLYDLVNNVFYTNQGTGAFTYGSVAPTPDTPMDIRVVKGDNTIKVTGKNLFDGEIEEGSLVSGANSSNSSHLRSKNYISIEPNKNYAFSVNGTQNRFVVNYYDKNKQWINTNNNDAGEISSTGSVTSPSNAKYMRFRSYRDDYNLILNGNIQIEQSSTSTPYQAYQEQTYPVNLKSKNLLPNLKTGTITDGNVTFVVNEDKSITINCDGTGTSGDYAYLTLITDTIGKNTFTLPAGTYTRYSSTSGTNIDGILLQTRENNTAGTEIYSSAGTSVKTTTLNSDTVIYPRVRVSRDVAFNNITIYPMIVSGEYTISTIPSYEPYYNYELCEIDKIRKSTGKNLFDINTITPSTYIQESGNTGSSTSTDLSDYIEVKPNTSYKLSFNYETLKNTNVRSYCYYDKDKTYISGNSYGPTNKNATITIPNNAKFVRFAYDKNCFDIQLEENNQATDYEPFGKVWYLKKNIGKVVLDGSEDGWGRGSSATTRSVYSINSFTDRMVSTSQSDFVSDKFSYVGNAQSTDLGYAMSFNTGTNSRYLYIQVPLDVVAYDHVADFKTWLSTHNTIVYYVLATPTTTEITDTTLIEQLEDLKTAKSVEGQTNITQTNEELPFIINASALSKI